jgi:hypothetical protein
MLPVVLAVGEMTSLGITRRCGRVESAVEEDAKEMIM